MTKTCCMCKQDLDISNFKSNSKRKDGLQAQCIECQKHYRRQHYLDNKQKYVDKAAKLNKKRRLDFLEIKKQYRCISCGEKDECCIDFHHLNPKEKDFELSIAHSFSQSRINKELAKCVALCSNCHRKVHAGKIDINVVLLQQ